VPVRSEPRIYEAPPDRLLTVVKDVERDVGTLLLVGHNPGFEELLGLLVRHEDRYAVKKYPTAGLAVIDVPASAWRELSPRSGHLVRFVTPKTLGLGEDE
jgi:phosphohistidine phosphatase